MTDHELNEQEYASRLDVGLWKRILRHARPYRGPLIGLATSGLVLAVADAVLPWLTGRVIDEAVANGPGRHLWELSLAYLGVVMLFGALIWCFIRLAGQVATGYANDLRRAAFAHLQELSFSFYDQRPVGWLMARLTSDTSRLSNVIPWTLLDASWGTSLVLGISVMMLLLNWKLALLVMLIIPPLALVSVMFQGRLIRSQRAMRKTNSLITASFNECITGVRTTKALVREAENLAEFQELSGNMYRYSIRNALQAAVYLPLVLTIGSIGVGLALWRGGIDVGSGMTLGTMIAFMQYAALFYIPIGEMAARFTDVQVAQASAERLQGLLDTEPEISDSPEVVAEAAGSRLRGWAADALPGSGALDRAVRERGRRVLAARDVDHRERIDRVVFENVSFHYVEDEPVLEEFNLEVNAGDTIALVGATGSGKTTIVSLLCRFYEPTSGSIRINGVEYRQRPLMWLQSRLGIVLQSPHLFSGSIRDNIRYGRLDATDGEVERAAKLVNAHGFITRMDRGYDTDVGERGDRLSTGQKQLVSLARAVLADPQIFVLDEATSSIDTETERLIQDGIERVLEGRISFIIAHRLSTIRRADRILVIDHGRVLEQGDHEELLARRGRYHELYTSQFTRESEDEVLASVATETRRRS